MGIEYVEQYRRGSNGVAWEALKLALETFKNINGDLTIAYRFVIPETTDWPEITRGV